MPTEPDPLTTAEVVHRAVETCEAGEVDERLGDLLARFEDAPLDDGTLVIIASPPKLHAPQVAHRVTPQLSGTAECSAAEWRTSLRVHT